MAGADGAWRPGQQAAPAAARIMIVTPAWPWPDQRPDGNPVYRRRCRFWPGRAWGNSGCSMPAPADHTPLRHWQTGGW